MKAYYRHLDNVVILRDNIKTEREEGRLEGREEGRAEGIKQGIEKGKRLMASKLKATGTPVELIIQVSGLSTEEVEGLKS